MILLISPFLRKGYNMSELKILQDTLGHINFTSILTAIIVLVCIVKIYKKIKDYFTELALTDKVKDDQMKKIMSQIEQYPKWRQQSIDRQIEFTKAIDNLKISQQQIIDEVKRIEDKRDQAEKQRKKIKRNELQDKLLQSYHIYASKEKNPTLAWSEMEKSAFEAMFSDYEELDGDGYMHTVVQPAMSALETVPMSNINRLTEVMQSRK